ncbi:MAG: hypothetical protein AB1592_12845 [Pseudomonadota bacterium]
MAPRRFIANVEDLRTRPELGTAGFGPQGSLAGAEAGLAGNLADMARQVGRIADERAQDDGEAAGTEAALAGRPDLPAGGSIYGDAYRKAAIRTYAGTLDAAMYSRIQDLATQFPDDPVALSGALGDLRGAMLQEDVLPDPVAKQAFAIKFDRATMGVQVAAARGASAAFSARERDAVRAAAEAAVGNVGVLARSLGSGPEALTATQAEATAAKDAINRARDAGALTFDEAARRASEVDWQRVASHVLGDFERLQDPAAKSDYMDQLEADWKAGRGVVAGLDERSFATLEKNLGSDLSLAERRDVVADRQARNRIAAEGIQRLAEDRLDEGWLAQNADALLPDDRRLLLAAAAAPEVDESDPAALGALFRGGPDAVSGALADVGRGALSRSDLQRVLQRATRMADDEAARPWANDVRREMAARLQPTQWQDPARARQQLRATDEFEAWLDANPGVAPAEAHGKANELVASYRGMADAGERADLPMPRFASAPRERMTKQDLRAAAVQLKADYDAGRIPGDDMRAEIGVLRRWNDLIDRSAAK